MSNGNLANLRTALTNIATLLGGLTYYLLQNPKQFRRVKDEICNKCPSNEDITFESLAECKYLNACLRKGLRVYPPVPIRSPRVVPAGGLKVLDQWIPQGTRVSVHQYSMYHSQDNFKDLDKFIPERWIAGENAEYANDVQDALQPFGWGHRNCLGQNMAMHEMRLILASVVRHFDFELCEESGPGWNRRAMRSGPRAHCFAGSVFIRRARFKAINHKASRMATVRLPAVEGHIYLSSAKK